MPILPSCPTAYIVHTPHRRGLHTHTLTQVIMGITPTAGDISPTFSFPSLVCNIGGEALARDQVLPGVSRYESSPKGRSASSRGVFRVAVCCVAITQSLWALFYRRGAMYSMSEPARTDRSYRRSSNLRSPLNFYFCLYFYFLFVFLLLCPYFFCLSLPPPPPPPTRVGTPTEPP